MSPRAPKSPSENEDRSLTVESPDKRDVTRLVDAVTVPTRANLLALTAEALAEDLVQLRDSDQPPPPEMVTIAEELAVRARDLSAVIRSLSDYPRPIRRSEAIYLAGLLRQACEDFQYRIATLTMDGSPPHPADAVAAAGLAYNAEVLHRLVTRRAPQR